PAITLGEFLERGNYPMALRLRYVAAMAGPIWSTSTRGVMDFPLIDFALFFDSHGLLNVYDRPQWQTLGGGSMRYVQALQQRLGSALRLQTPVLGLRRRADAPGVCISTAAGDETFDAAVCAIHSDQALALLCDADDAE